MATFPIIRIGTNLGVADVARSVAFYRDHLGFEVDALYDEPPFAILVRDGVRVSFAEQGHALPERPDTAMATPHDVSRPSVVLVLEVADAVAVHEALAAEGASASLSEVYSPPWGGHEFFIEDSDGYLVEVEQFA